MDYFGHSLIWGHEPSPPTDEFRAVDPATGLPIDPAFHSASQTDVAEAARRADACAATFRAAPLAQRARLLDAIADRIEAIGEPLIARAMAESGLPQARLTGERGRTVGQLRMFANVVRDGGFQDIRIDPAMPDRAPMPRSDLRLRKIALGPVAVFGASNFPLAFSVAGGDTASALAAGCPVVAKAHPAHPGTSELVGRAIIAAIADVGLPAGIFSLVGGPGTEVGSALVADPRIKAVGFTGSRGGGLALARIAAARDVPIPVYAEMSAINPVILLPAALDERADALGAGYVGSLTMGAGQFCTNPGLVVAIDSPALDRFVDAARAAVEAAPAQVMLTPAIHAAFSEGVDRLAAHDKIDTLGRGIAGAGPHDGQAALFAVRAEHFEGDDITGEVFGASSVLVRCRDEAELAAVLAKLEGQLTATLHAAPADHDLARRLLPALEEKVGRILVNGWPTGVEVSSAMVHGGPYPATTDGRSTSVGTLAIDRFLRPVCYQDFPADLLPPELRDDAVAGIPHRVDGKPVVC